MDTTKFEVIADKAAKGRLKLRCKKCGAESTFNWNPGTPSPDLDDARTAFFNAHTHK